MDNDRNYIINRLRSKKISIDEFNYDRLQAPPLNFFLSPNDIDQIRYIATSLRYSAKPEVRYSEIDKIVKRRGLVKFGAGTNRVVYRHPEFPDYLFKIAADDVGMRDNPAEFRNQFILKPFVAKCFEVSPCGTVALVERVNPITSREEFISVADDVFELLTEYIIGKYVIADCGTRQFMNVGIRESFGIVLLDYPYVYELDGNKLYCNRRDVNSPTGTCDGVIDYDDGFNQLVCTKCGAIYKAKELEKKIHDNEIIKQGETKMKVRINGGTNNVNINANTDPLETNDLFQPMKSSIVKAQKSNKNNNSARKIKVRLGEDTKDAVKSNLAITINRSVEPVVDVEATVVEETIDSSKYDVTKSVNGVKSSEYDKTDMVNNIIDHVLEKETKKEEEEKVVVKEVRSPISFNDSYKEEDYNVDTSSSPVETIEKLLVKLEKAYNEIKIGTVKDSVKDTIKTKVAKMFGEEVESSEDAAEVEEVSCENENIPVMIEKTLKKLNDYIDATSDSDYETSEWAELEGFKDLYYKLYESNVEVTDCETENDDMIVSINIVTNIIGEKDSFSVIEKAIKIVDAISLFGDEDTEDTNSESDNTTSDENRHYKGSILYDGFIVKLNQLDPTQQPIDVIVCKDAEGNYVAKDNNIICIDTIDCRSLQSIELVSKKWMEDVTENDTDEITHTEMVGALPPIDEKTKEFLNNYEKAGE